MRKNWVNIKAQMQILLEYRSDLIVYTVSSAISPLIGLVIWLTISNSGVNLNFSNSELVLYFLLVILVNSFTASWSSWFIATDINEGSFSKYLIKPFSVLEEYIGNNIGEKVYKLIVLFFTLCLILPLLLPNLSLNIKITWMSFILFFISLIMAAAITLLLDVCIGLLTIWVHDIYFLGSLFSLTREFLSGKIIPLIFLPAFLLPLIIFSPFRYMISFPIEVLLNRLSFNDLLIGFSFQIIWLFFSVLFYKVVYLNGVKHYQGYGG